MIYNLPNTFLYMYRIAMVLHVCISMSYARWACEVSYLFLLLVIYYALLCQRKIQTDSTVTDDSNSGNPPWLCINVPHEACLHEQLPLRVPWKEGRKSQRLRNEIVGLSLASFIGKLPTSLCSWFMVKNVKQICLLVWLAALGRGPNLLFQFGAISNKKIAMYIL